MVLKPPGFGRVGWCLGFFIMLEEPFFGEVNIEKLNEIESDFLAGISHELKTPLTVIKESNALLLEGLGGTLSPLQLRLLEISRKNIERLSQQADADPGCQQEHIAVFPLVMLPEKIERRGDE